MAAKAPPMRSIVNPDDARFLNPADMPKAIQDFCRETKQPVPKTEGELVRCAYESLALKYREVLGWLEELGGEHIEVIHIVGGGSQSKMLNQFAADACQRPVVAGPVEATALGNLLVQVRASGEIKFLVGNPRSRPQIQPRHPLRTRQAPGISRFPDTTRGWERIALCRDAVS